MLTAYTAVDIQALRRAVKCGVRICVCAAGVGNGLRLGLGLGLGERLGYGYIAILQIFQYPSRLLFETAV